MALFGKKGGKPSFGDVALNVLGHVGDAVSRHSGGAAIYGPMQAQRQQMQYQREVLAQQQRQQAELLAQRTQAQYGLADYKAKLAAGQPPKPGSFEWYQSATPQERATYDQYNPFVVSTGAGPVAVPRRPAVGSKVSMADIGGAPSGQSTQGQTITRQQYQGMVDQMGKQRTQAWLQSSGVRVSN
jgi:hypothetical protein